MGGGNLKKEKPSTPYFLYHNFGAVIHYIEAYKDLT